MKHFVLAVLFAAWPVLAGPVAEKGAAPEAADQVVSSPKPGGSDGAASPETVSPTASSIGAPPSAFLSIDLAGAPSGRFELRPYPSGRERALHYLRGEEKAAALTIDRKTARSSGLELPLGFWQLIFRVDRGGGAVELPLTPFKAPRVAGRLPGPAATRRVEIVDEDGKSVAGALVGQTAFGNPARPWHPAFFRAQSDGKGGVQVPTAFRATLWVLAPGFEPYAGHHFENEPPKRIVLVKQAWRTVHLVDRYQQPVVGALLRSRSGVPLGFTDEQGQLEGPFAERTTVLIDDAKGRGFRERIVLQRTTGELRLQVGRAEPIRGEVVARGSGETLDGAWVWLAGRPETWRVAERRGQFEIYDFWDDPTSIEADFPGYSSGKVLAGREDLATIRLAPVDRVLFGKVTDMAGEPLVGARIAVSTQGSKVTFTTTTNELGQYRLAGLPYEELWAEASHFSAFPLSKKFSRTFPDVRLDFELERGGFVLGKVVAEFGGALAQVAVLKVPPGAGDPELLGRTNEEGEFSIGPLPSGSHTLVFEARDFAKLEFSVDLPKNQIEVPLGEIVLKEELRWGGRVVDENETPLQGVRVFVWKERLETDTEYAPWRSADAISDSEGRFVLAGLAKERTIDLEMRIEGRPPQLFRRVVVSESNDGKDWPVPLGARLEVEVVDPRREPVFAAEVTLPTEDEENPRHWQFSDEDGKVIYPTLAAGTYVVQVKAKGFGIFHSENIELFAGQRRKVVVPLGEGITLEGRVFQPNGEPARGYRVAVAPPGKSDREVEARVDAEGYYRIEGLPRGQQEIQITGNRFFAIYKQKMELDAPFESLDVTLPKSSSRNLVVLVVDENGRAMSGVEVMVTRPDGVGARQETDHEGMVILSGMPEDKYDILAAAPDRTWKEASTDMTLDGPTRGVVLVLEKVPEPEPE